MAQGTRKDTEKKQRKYIAARLAGNNKTQARNLAGYAKTTPVQQIESPGNPVHTRLMAALAERGLDEEYLANGYRTGLDEARTEKGRKGDYNAYFKGLLQLSYLLGHGKKEQPGVAIQINNGPSGELDAERSGQLLERLASVCEALEKKAGSGQLSGLPAGDPGDENASPRSGVGEVVIDGEAVGGGGES